MKRRERIRRLEQAGCRLQRHGGAHDWYVNERAKRAQAVPKIDEQLARGILKVLTNTEEPSQLAD